jgi:hypothetical protein
MNKLLRVKNRLPLMMYTTGKKSEHGAFSRIQSIRKDICPKIIILLENKEIQ